MLVLSPLLGTDATSLQTFSWHLLARSCTLLLRSNAVFRLSAGRVDVRCQIRQGLVSMTCGIPSRYQDDYCEAANPIEYVALYVSSQRGFAAHGAAGLLEPSDIQSQGFLVKPKPLTRFYKLRKEARQIPKDSDIVPRLKGNPPENSPSLNPCSRFHSTVLQPVERYAFGSTFSSISEISYLSPLISTAQAKFICWWRGASKGKRKRWRVNVRGLTDHTYLEQSTSHPPSPDEKFCFRSASFRSWTGRFSLHRGN